MECNKKNSTDLRTMMNYPRPGRKSLFNRDGTIAKKRGEDGKILPSVKDMTEKEKREYGRQTAPKD